MDTSIFTRKEKEDMLRRRFGAILTAIVMASGMLLSSCASKKSTQDPMGSEYFEVKVKPDSKEEVVTNGTSPTPKDYFYDTKTLDLAAPDLSSEIGLPRLYSYADTPFMTQDYILIPYSQVYSKKQDIYAVINSDIAYGDPTPDEFIEVWAIYDMNGHYCGSMMNKDNEWMTGRAVDFFFGIRFAQDKNGNLVAVYSSYDETDEGSSYNLHLARYAPDGTELKAPICLIEYVDEKPKGLCVTQDDLVVVATTRSLICFTMEGQPLSYCTFPFEMNCIGMWEQNGKIYVQLLPGIAEGDTYDAPYHFYEGDTREDSRILSFSIGSSGVLSIDNSCRNGEGLLAMRSFQGKDGVYAATKNALGVMDMESGEFSMLLDWNQSNIDRKLLEMGTIQVLSEGERTQTISVIPDESLPFPAVSMEVIGPDESWTMEEPEADYVSDSDEGAFSEDGIADETNIADSDSYLETNSTSEVTETDETDETTVLDPANDPASSDSKVTRVAVATTVETESGRDAKLILLEPMDDNPHQGQQVIWIGGCHLVESRLAQSVARYNADPEHPFWIKLHEYTDYYNDVIHIEGVDSDAVAVETMKAQIYSGNGPDIIYSSGTSMDLDNGSCLTDLNPYMDGKNGINREEYYDSVFRAFETKGKLYEVPLSFRIMSAAADVDRIGKIDNITTLDLLNCEGNLKSGETIYASYSSSAPLAWMASSEMGSWLDKDAGEVLVSKETLMNLMQLSKDQNQQVGASTYSFDTSDYSVLSRRAPMNSFSYGYGFLHMCEFGSIDGYMEGFAYPGNYAWIGVPGSRDNLSVVHSNMAVGISAYSTQKEQAWEVIRYFLSVEEQDQFCKEEVDLYSFTASYFPVFRGSFYKNYLDRINQNLSYDYSVPVDESEYTFVTVPVTTDTETDMDNLLSAPHRRFVYDEEAFKIILEETYQFISGTKTKEQAANDALTRLKAYVTG